MAHIAAITVSCTVSQSSREKQDESCALLAPENGGMELQLLHAAEKRSV